MKIILLAELYPNHRGDVTQIELSEELFTLLMRLDHDWKLLKRKDKRYYDKDGYEESETELKASLIHDAVERDAIRMIEAKRVRALLSTLTNVQRRRVQAYFFEGLTYTQIALVEGVSEGAVRHAIEAAIEKLKIIL